MVATARLPIPFYELSASAGFVSQLQLLTLTEKLKTILYFKDNWGEINERVVKSGDRHVRTF